MKLDALLEDLSAQFRISAAHCGCVYNGWLRASAKLLLQYLVFSPNKEALKIQNVSTILDSSEIFTEGLKDYKMQDLT